MKRLGWVVGIIDSYGAVHARETAEGHTYAERLAGRPFRWNLWDQEFHAVLGKDRLNADEIFAVEDWLERNGFKEER